MQVPPRVLKEGNRGRWFEGRGLFDDRHAAPEREGPGFGHADDDAAVPLVKDLPAAQQDRLSRRNGMQFLEFYLIMTFN